MRKLFFVLLFTNIFFAVLTTNLNAQIQGDEFSGNDVANYQCIIPGGGVRDFVQAYQDEGLDPANPQRTVSGKFACPDGSEAILKPPTLQQIELWFVRILYVIWAIVASLSFFYLVILGYRYMITRGDVTKITEIRQKIIYYIVGFILVFLAIPILTTVFRLLGVNTDVQCYNVAMPGFQFFFTELCTGQSANLDAACANGERIEGLTCSNPGATYSCNGPAGGIYQCGRVGTSTQYTWVRVAR